MSWDPARLAELARARGPFVRVLVAGTRGSSPREAGAEMCVWADSFTGTIGGGALEWLALQEARAGLAEGTLAPGLRRAQRVTLGPELGQCCAGVVELVLEGIGPDLDTAGEPGWRLCPIDTTAPPPDSLRRAQAAPPRPAPPRLVSGWLIESALSPARPVWIWGAGHVGRALAEVLAPLPDFALIWADVDASRFPPAPPAGVRIEATPDLVALAATVPADAHHLIVTHSHMLDLELCHVLLGRGAGRIGLIGSVQKQARFAARLRDLGHGPGALAAITCPIGDPALGKHPQAIALGVACALVKHDRAAAPCAAAGPSAEPASDPQAESLP
ncbi:xanthine dehydrogenase accessory protein XdhC [Phaeovulum vinaykumarii]|uniref:Xanthine dehydrogenase accessory factor n=1 Tax=Phaeovulum vinaykumarii TaxID=407234 RepID=A0A1N7LGB4_9RHOB|nr:xanthine dehydrogenase accessory protein XdhC [Phaeovulum vinaykumarii]SIS72870.1 xanthine dehydrogenase accessory factor [Phaeovulum vinaykumarii]SOC04544.1 xanthine dehydrogenase accessory factor [Phaeovulum vinaykumarii]